MLSPDKVWNEGILKITLSFFQVPIYIIPLALVWTPCPFLWSLPSGVFLHSPSRKQGRYFEFKISFETKKKKKDPRGHFLHLLQTDCSQRWSVGVSKAPAVGTSWQQPVAIPPPPPVGSWHGAEQTPLDHSRGLLGIFIYLNNLEPGQLLPRCVVDRERQLWATCCPCSPHADSAQISPHTSPAGWKSPRRVTKGIRCGARDPYHICLCLGTWKTL